MIPFSVFPQVKTCNRKLILVNDTRYQYIFGMVELNERYYVIDEVEPII